MVVSTWPDPHTRSVVVMCPSLWEGERRVGERVIRSWSSGWGDDVNRLVFHVDTRNQLEALAASPHRTQPYHR